MDQKRVFEILDELNVGDTNNGTKHVVITNSVTQMQSCKAGGLITMGVPSDIFSDLAFPEEGKNKIAILVVVDKTAYDKIKQR